MLSVRRHALVKADLSAAFYWYEEQQPGLGQEFFEDLVRSYRLMRAAPLHYAVRFGEVRRSNLERFPYGIFYVLKPGELRVLARLHPSRDLGPVLLARRHSFTGGQR